MTPDYHSIELQDSKGNVRIAYICDLCGQERHPGDWPDCRKAGSHVNETGSFGDEPMEPRIEPHIDTVPRLFTTRGELRKFIDSHHLEVVPKITRPPGSVRYLDMAKR